MKLKEFNTRNPFILPCDGKYYLYYTNTTAFGCNIYMLISDDLENWTECECKIKYSSLFNDDGALIMPAVTHHNGKFYLTAAYKNDNSVKSIYIFVGDSPRGEFSLLSDVPLTPPDWECISGSIYFDKNSKPHLIFSHEWIQINDGTVCSMQLSDDLSRAVCEPKKLFSASEHKSVLTLRRTVGSYVADGPYLHRFSDGVLTCMWSTITADGYTVLVAKSDNGDIDGNWRMLEKPFATVNGGHGMFFKDFNGKTLYVMHQPNVVLCEKSIIFDFIKNNDGVYIIQ